MEKKVKNFWDQLIKNWGITKNGKITKGIFKGRDMAEVYNYFSNKAWDYPSMICFFSTDTEEFIRDEMSMHPEANEFEEMWDCNMDFDT